MMIEIMYPNDIEKIISPKIQAYLYKRFKEIDYSLIPHIEGYFLYVKDFSLLHESHRLNHLILPSISEGLFDHVEGVSIEGDIVEVSLVYNNSFLMSLVFNGLDEKSLEIVTKEGKDEKRDI